MADISPQGSSRPATAGNSRTSQKGGRRGSVGSIVADTGTSESIGVFARFKPIKAHEERGEVEVSKRFGEQKSVTIKNLEFSLDWIFDTDSTQDSIFDIAAADRVDALLAGYNATLMAYGQTGSGKTHTMFGPDEVLVDFKACDPAHYGLVPRAAIRLFEGVEARTSDSTFIVQCSYLEVYNDRLNDLLGRQQDLRMRELGGGKGISVEGLTMEVVTSVEEVMSALKRGQDQRVVAPMAMNARSSRGHGIFTIYLKEMMASGPERHAKLNLVDLAGMRSMVKVAVLVRPQLATGSSSGCI